jgi:hypothetical protein
MHIRLLRARHNERLPGLLHLRIMHKALVGRSNFTIGAGLRPVSMVNVDMSTQLHTILQAY